MAVLHRSVLDIQKDLKEIKIDFEGFKSRVVELEHNFESFTNLDLDFQTKPLNQFNINIDIVHNTYGLQTFWNDKANEPLLFSINILQIMTIAS